MKFLDYINNWSKNFKSIKIDDTYLDDSMRKHVETCNHCSGFISLHTICQDKFLSYLFVEKFGWPIPNQYFNGFAKDFPEDLLNNNIVIKATHGCSSREVICIKNGVDFFTKEEISGNSLIEKFNNKFIISEELLIDKEYNHDIPLDFKCFVFNGNIELLCICETSLENKRKHAWYDKNMNLLGSLIKNVPIFKESDKYLPSPEEFNQMKYFCKDFRVFNNLFLRIDFYITKKGVFFGEFTPHPYGGKGYSDKFLNILDKLMIDYKI